MLAACTAWLTAPASSARSTRSLVAPLRFPKSRSWLSSFRGGAHDRRAEAQVHRGSELLDQHSAEKLALAPAPAAERLAEVADEQAQHHRVDLFGEPRRIARERRRVGGPLERKHRYWIDVHRVSFLLNNQFRM